jgi:hypothetical protein
MDSGSEQVNSLDRIGRLERAVDDLRRRLEQLEETVSSVEAEIRDLNEAEDIGVTQ